LRGVLPSPLHDRRWAAAFALAAGACAEPRKLTLRIAQAELLGPSDAGAPDAGAPDGGAPWCVPLEGTPDRARARQMLDSPQMRRLCVAFVAHPDGDARELFQVYALRTQRVNGKATAPCLGGLGTPLAVGLGGEDTYVANVVVIDLDRPTSDYLLTRRAVPPGDDAREGSWCLDAFRCTRLYNWVHDEVVQRCLTAPEAPGGACNLRLELADVCPVTRLSQ